MVLITALIGDLHRRYRSDVDVVTSGPWSEPLLRGQPGVGEILSVRSRSSPYWLSPDQQRVVQRLRTRGVGPAWFCDGNEAALPLLVRAGISSDFIVNSKNHPLRTGEHATQQWRRIARIDPGADSAITSTGGPGGPSASVSPGGCRLLVDDAQRADLDAWLRTRRLQCAPLIAVQIGNKRTMRRGFKRLAVNTKFWPNERWASVLRHLRRRHPSHAIVLLGTGPEYRLNEELAGAAQIDHLYNVADDLPVRRLVALLARADGMVTVDSGPAHAAAAVGCPQVVLFGQASTSLYRPWGTAEADVAVLTGQIQGEPSMLGIEADSVMQAWDALRLNRERAACPG